MSTTSLPEQSAEGAGADRQAGAPTVEQVMHALAGVIDPEIRRPITELGMVKNIEVGAEGAVRVEVYLTVSGCPMRDTITREVRSAVGKVTGVATVQVDLDVMSDDQRRE